MKISTIVQVFVKDVYGSFFYFRYIFLFHYIHNRKDNAKFNKLIKTVVHRARVFFEKIILNTPTFANKFGFIWIFSCSHLSSPKVVTKHLTC